VIARGYQAAHLRLRGGGNQAAGTGAVSPARSPANRARCILIDTAGRLHIDEQFDARAPAVEKEFNPTEVLFVADAMTGQDAVKSADEFHKRLGITVASCSPKWMAMRAAAGRFPFDPSPISR